ncbi:MAG: HD domain-containing protein [Actinobacteria bacterium]|nr:HD domain-containing protein [Actinomycetota bacterium]
MAVDGKFPSEGELGERAEKWASTMRGHHHDGVAFAHEDSWAGPGDPAVISRQEREERQDRSLARLATRPHGAGSRLVEESPDPFRTCFQRDRDRILHASAFRRLAGKTQVFVFPDDHQRTRLTHALEVAQIARSIAEPLGLNVDLAEAIAIGHDCGHGPGGHASEDAFSPYLNDGYDHAVWGADVTLVPLKDAVAAGIVTPSMLPDIVASRCGTARSQQLGTFVRAMLSATEQSGRIGMTADIAEALSEFRGFNYDNIYLRPASTRQAQSVISMLQALVEHFTAHTYLIPVEVLLNSGPTGNDDESLFAAVSWVSGMTDRYACGQAVELLGWQQDQLPAGIDV